MSMSRKNSAEVRSFIVCLLYRPLVVCLLTSKSFASKTTTDRSQTRLLHCMSAPYLDRPAIYKDSVSSSVHRWFYKWSITVLKFLPNSNSLGRCSAFSIFTLCFISCMCPF